MHRRRLVGSEKMSCSAVLASIQSVLRADKTFEELLSEGLREVVEIDCAKLLLRND